MMQKISFRYNGCDGSSNSKLLFYLAVTQCFCFVFIDVLNIKLGGAVSAPCWGSGVQTERNW